MKKLILSLISIVYSALGHAAAAPTMQANVISQTEILRIITWLFIVLIIILVLSWLAKRLQNVNLGNTYGLKSIASMALGPKEKMVLIRAGEQYLLLGVTTGSVNMLYDFGRVLPQGFDPENKASFAQVLKNVVGKS